jgi:hypothetical protein
MKGLIWGFFVLRFSRFRALLGVIVFEVLRENGPRCRNLSLGLTTETRGCKVTSQEKDLGVTSHALGSAKKVRE